MYNIETNSESHDLKKPARISVRSSEVRSYVVESDEFISSSGALMHYLKGSIASGILAVPMAFKQAGLVFGSLFLIIIALAVTHAFTVLVRLSQDICWRHDLVARSYSETAHGVLEYGPKKLRKYKKIICGFIDGGLFATYLAVVAFYIVFIAHSVKEMILKHLNYDLDDRLYMLMIYLPILFVTQIRALKYIVPLSLIANVLLVITLGIMFYYLFKSELTFKDKALIPQTITGFPEFYCISIFALTSIGPLMPIENKMRNPHDYARNSGVIHIGMVITTIIYALIGFMGYVRYGEDIQPSIALNFPGNEVPALIGKICIVSVIYLTVPVQFHVPLEIWSRLKRNTYRTERQIFLEIVFRVGLLLLCTLCAIAIPSLKYIISLTGAIFFSSLGLCFPVLLELIYLWEHLSLRQQIFILIKNVPIILLSVIGFISGTSVSIKEIIKLYQ